ncbi:hypothetical protein C8J57DRAFT_1533873 [Mycena rebaudengoi]|nr:hypothetical protein C8J57DRAFT_1533873 [Mycena rebaudengoi]
MTLRGPQWENVRVLVLFDMMDKVFFRRVHECLGKGKLSAPTKQLKMANSTIIPSVMHWAEEMEIWGVIVVVEFEVFDSGGLDIAAGKLLQAAFGVVHDIVADIILIDVGGHTVVLQNQHPDAVEKRWRTQICEDMEHAATSVVDAGEAAETQVERLGDDDKAGTHAAFIGAVSCACPCEDMEHAATSVMDAGEAAETQVERLGDDDKAGTHAAFIGAVSDSDLFNLKCVEAILKLIRIGPNLTEEQQARVHKFVMVHTNVFALAISKVRVTKGAVYMLKIPKDTEFSLKVNQHPFTKLQAALVHCHVDELITTGTLRPITAQDVKCINPIHLVEKDKGVGLSYNQLLHEVNDQCVAAGLLLADNLPLWDPERPVHEPQPPKWCICGTFPELNKLLKTVPMLQGNIHDKQCRLSGHRYMSIYDFMSGFFTLAIHDEVQPYIVIYIPGGFFRLHAHAVWTDRHPDMIMELFVDNGGSVVDTFDGMMGKLETIFACLRKEDLSVSPAKTQLFMMEATFAGSVIGPKGVSPDL